jgi:hypothetical protein
VAVLLHLARVLPCQLAGAVVCFTPLSPGKDLQYEKVVRLASQADRGALRGFDLDQAAIHSAGIVPLGRRGEELQPIAVGGQYFADAAD